MENIERILEQAGAGDIEPLKDFLKELSEHKRQRLSDDILVYEIITQQIEALGEACEMCELTKDIAQLAACAEALGRLVSIRNEHTWRMDND